jgi:hypothetical protein
MTRPIPIRRTPALALATVLALGGLGLAPGPAGAGSRYFHLVAEDLDNDGERVSINVPFAIVASALALVPYDEIHGGQLRVNGRVLSREDLQEFWTAVKATGEGEPLEIVVEEGQRRYGRGSSGDRERRVVRLERKGGTLSITSNEDDGERVVILLPSRFVEALLAGGAETFTLENMIQAFANLEAGSPGSDEAIRIDSDDARVRIWVDDKIGAAP